MIREPLVDIYSGPIDYDKLTTQTKAFQEKLDTLYVSDDLKGIVELFRQQLAHVYTDSAGEADSKIKKVRLKLLMESVCLGGLGIKGSLISKYKFHYRDFIARLFLMSIEDTDEYKLLKSDVSDAPGLTRRKKFFRRVKGIFSRRKVKFTSVVSVKPLVPVKDLLFHKKALDDKSIKDMVKTAAILVEAQVLEHKFVFNILNDFLQEYLDSRRHVDLYRYIHLREDSIPRPDSYSDEEQARIDIQKLAVQRNNIAISYYVQRIFLCVDAGVNYAKLVDIVFSDIQKDTSACLIQKSLFFIRDLCLALREAKIDANIESILIIKNLEKILIPLAGERGKVDLFNILQTLIQILSPVEFSSHLISALYSSESINALSVTRRFFHFRSFNGMPFRYFVAIYFSALSLPVETVSDARILDILKTQYLSHIVAQVFSVSDRMGLLEMLLNSKKMHKGLLDFLEVAMCSYSARSIANDFIEINIEFCARIIAEVEDSPKALSVKKAILARAYKYCSKDAFVRLLTIVCEIAELETLAGTVAELFSYSIKLPFAANKCIRSLPINISQSEFMIHDSYPDVYSLNALANFYPAKNDALFNAHLSSKLKQLNRLFVPIEDDEISTTASSSSYDRGETYTPVRCAKAASVAISSGKRAPFTRTTTPAFYSDKSGRVYVSDSALVSRGAGVSSCPELAGL